MADTLNKLETAAARLIAACTTYDARVSKVADGLNAVATDMEAANAAGTGGATQGGTGQG